MTSAVHPGNAQIKKRGAGGGGGEVNIKSLIARKAMGKKRSIKIWYSWETNTMLQSNKKTAKGRQ